MRPVWLMAIVLSPLLFGLAGCLGVSRTSRSGERAEAVASFERCVWVDRWDYRTEADVRRVIQDCGALGFRTVFFQVRGAGTVYYPSRFEAWSPAYGFRDPGFDPLQIALDEARGLGIDLHAWVNLIPGWSGEKAPDSSAQLWRVRPQWFLRNESGAREPFKKGRYLGLNPGFPEVRDYLSDLCWEVVSRYPVAGLHIDYVRFTDFDHNDGGPYPRDSRSLGECRRAGFDPGNPTEFAQWKRESITALVSQIRGRMPDGMPLTSAVIADPATARRHHHQDWGEWARLGLIDALMPMNYTSDDGAFRSRVRAGVSVAGGVPLVVGVGVYRHDGPSQTRRQIEAAEAAGAAGIAFFNYRTLAKEAKWRRAFLTDIRAR